MTIDRITAAQGRYRQSYTARQSIIEQKKKDLKLYINQGKQEEVLQNSLLYSTVNTYAAMSYMDKLELTFLGRELWDDERAEILTEVAKFDYQEMWLDEDEINKVITRAIFGVNIDVFWGWDKEASKPVYKTVNPLTWFPDPAGHTHIKNFRYSGFAIETTINELKAIGGYKNLNQIDTEVSKELRELTDAQNEAFNKQDSQKFVQDEDTPISIYIEYARVDGKWVVTTFANQISLILKEEDVILTSSAGKKNPAKAEMPINLVYRVAIEGNPWGISIPDEIRDKQRALTILDNLRLIAEKDASIGIGYIYDETSVRGDDLLNRDPFEVSLIPTDWPTNNKVEAIQGKWPTNSGFNVAQAIERDASIATGISSSQSGVISSESRTATEIQATQANSNLRQLFTNRVTLQGKKHFWELWYMSYVTYFAEEDKKVVRLVGSLRNKIKIFRRSEIVTNTDPDIVIESKAEKTAEDQKHKADFFTTYFSDIQDQDTSEIGRMRLKRRAKELQGWDKDEIMATYPKTSDEMQAWDDIQEINENQYVWVEDLSQDHMTYIVIYENAEDTPAKYASIMARKIALGMQKQMTAQAWEQQTNAVANQAQAQFSNAGIQQNRQKDMQSQNVSNL